MQLKSDIVLFFDLDGTLVDTSYSNFLAYQKAIKSVTKSNVNLIFNQTERFNRSVLKSSFPFFTNSEIDRIIIEKERCYNEFLQETKLIMENTKILMTYSGTNNTVLVSNCRSDRAMTILNYHGIAHKFSNIFCRELGCKEEKINKFQNAISKLGVSPNLIIAFEDENSEIEDARNSGILIINPKNLK